MIRQNCRKCKWRTSCLQQWGHRWYNTNACHSKKLQEGARRRDGERGRRKEAGGRRKEENKYIFLTHIFNLPNNCMHFWRIGSWIINCFQRIGEQPFKNPWNMINKMCRKPAGNKHIRQQTNKAKLTYFLHICCGSAITLMTWCVLCQAPRHLWRHDLCNVQETCRKNVELGISHQQNNTKQIYISGTHVQSFK